MISVLHGGTSILGSINTITADLLCLVDTINKLKREEPEKWEAIVEEFKELGNKTYDNGFVYKSMKELITNLQDLY